MPRSMFGLTSLWGGLAVLSLCGTASAQWYSGNSCGCSSPTYMGSPPIMRQSAFFGAAPMMPVSTAYANDSVQCGAPVACHIEQPVQTVHVQAVAPVHTQVVAVQPLQQIVQPIVQTVQATEMRPIKQTVQRPVVRTEYVDQAVTVMTPVSELKTQNVAHTDYQTITEYKTVQKQVGYWVTKNVPTNKVSAYQYDNRPNAAGAVNRAAYNMRTAFTPQYTQQRTFVPQTMTCTVPCKRTVAVPGMKQVTYQVTRMQPTQTTRKVAVQRVDYEATEVTVMAPHLVTKTVQVGHRISYAHPSSSAITSNPASGGIGLAPTPDPNSSAAQPKTQATNPNDGLKPDQFNNKRTSAVESNPEPIYQLTETSTVLPRKTATAKPELPSTAIRVNQWVARGSSPAKNNPQPSDKSTAISVADSTR